MKPSAVIVIILLVLAAFGAAGAALHHYGETRYAAGVTAGKADVQGRWDAATIQAGAVATTAAAQERVIEFNRQEATNAAIQQAVARATINGGAAAGARTEFAGLRSDLAASAAARADPVRGYTLEACRADLTARDTVLEDLAGAGGTLAGEADGHASDSLTYQQAWPK